MSVKVCAMGDIFGDDAVNPAPAPKRRRQEGSAKSVIVTEPEENNLSEKKKKNENLSKKKEDKNLSEKKKEKKKKFGTFKKPGAIKSNKSAASSEPTKTEVEKVAKDKGRKGGLLRRIVQLVPIIWLANDCTGLDCDNFVTRSWGANTRTKWTSDIKPHARNFIEKVFRPERIFEDMQIRKVPPKPARMDLAGDSRVRVL